MTVKKFLLSSLLLFFIASTLWQCSSKDSIVINPDYNYLPVQINDTWGFITNSGDYLIYPKFDEVMPFSEGMAAVCTGEKWGFIDTLGRVIVKPQYDAVTIYKEGKAFVQNDKGQFECIDAKGNVLFTLTDATACSVFCRGVAEIVVAGVKQYVDATGQRCQGTASVMCAPVCESGLTVQQGSDGKFGYVDSTGKFVIAATYDAAADFRNYIAAVTQSGKIGFIDRKGKMIIEPRYDASYPQCDMITSLTKDTLNVKAFVSRFLHGTNERCFKGFSSSNTLQNLLQRGEYRVEAQALILSSRIRLTPYLTLVETQYGFDEPIMKMNKNLTFNYEDGFNHTDDSLMIEYTDEELDLHDVTYTFELVEGYSSVVPLLMKELRNQLSAIMATPCIRNNNNYTLENKKMRVMLIAPISQSDSQMSIEVTFK